MRVVRTRAASRQIREETRWWRRNRPAAPSLFSREIRQVTRLIGRHPESGHIASDVALEGVRCILLVATQYYLYYYVNENGDRIDVLAVWSTHRGDAPPI